MIKKFEINGLRVEKYIQNINNENYIEDERYIFNCKSDGNNYEILLYFDYSSTTQKRAKLTITKISHFVGTSYIPKSRFFITIDSSRNEQYNEAFEYNCNSITIKYEKFKITKRMKKYRPVWIYKGQSNLGKSYLTTILANNSYLTTYETDSNPELPEVLFQDIIVIGNKYKFRIDEIETKIYGLHESILVDFSIYSYN